MKSTLIILLTIFSLHSINAQVYYDKDTIYLTVEQLDVVPKGVKPILHNNTSNDIEYSWRRTILKGPHDLDIFSEDHNLLTFMPSLCSQIKGYKTNITKAGGFSQSIGIAAIFTQPDSLPWVILFEVLKSPSCESVYASVVYVVEN